MRRTLRPAPRAWATISGLGGYPGGQARAKSIPSRSAHSISEWATLLPSPTNASFSPPGPPKRSRMVCISASAWQGWNRSLSALITGTRDQCARSSTVACEKTRATMPFTQRSRLRATSLSGSRTPRPFGKERIAAQLLDGQLEGQARAQRGLLEEQGDGLSVQRMGVIARRTLYQGSQVEQGAQLVAGEVEVPEQIGSGHPGRRADAGDGWERRNCQ